MECYNCGSDTVLEYEKGCENQGFCIRPYYECKNCKYSHVASQRMLDEEMYIKIKFENDFPVLKDEKTH